jgi:hypothetical protein
MLTVRKRLLAPFMALAMATSIAACADDSAGPETGTDVEEVAEEPMEDETGDDEAAQGAESLVGQTVTVSAEISEVISPGAIRIGGDEGGDESLLVVSGAAESFAEMGFGVSEGLVDDDVVVQVTGTVREFDIADFEEEFGVDYDDDLFEPFEGEHVIVADDVSTLAGEPITISGHVQSVLSTVAFRLAGTGWNVVVLDAQQAQVDEGDFVQVQGTVRQLNIAELEKEFGTDLADEAYRPHEGDLVLVAEKVTQAAPAQP